MNSLVGRRQGMDRCYLLLVGTYTYVYLFLGSTLKSLKWLVPKWHHHRCMWPLLWGQLSLPLHRYIHRYTFSLASCILATSIYSSCHRQFIHFFFFLLIIPPWWQVRWPQFQSITCRQMFVPNSAMRFILFDFWNALCFSFLLMARLDQSLNIRVMCSFH